MQLNEKELLTALSTEKDKLKALQEKYEKVAPRQPVAVIHPEENWDAMTPEVRQTKHIPLIKIVPSSSFFY